MKVGGDLVFVNYKSIGIDFEIKIIQVDNRSLFLLRESNNLKASDC